MVCSGLRISGYTVVLVLLTGEEGKGLAVLGDVGSGHLTAYAVVGQGGLYSNVSAERVFIISEWLITYGVALVGIGLTTTDRCARVHLRCAPRLGCR